MGNKGPVRYRKYTDEFKVEAIRLAESVGVAAAAKRLGVADGNLRPFEVIFKLADFLL